MSAIATAAKAVASVTAAGSTAVVEQRAICMDGMRATYFNNKGV